MRVLIIRGAGFIGSHLAEAYLERGDEVFVIDDRSTGVYGDGKQTRCFTYVKDTTEALVRLMDREEAEGEIVNVGREEEVTIEELGRRVVALASSSSEIRLVPYGEVYPRDFEDMQRRVPALDKVERPAGFRPHTPLATFLREVIGYRRVNLE